MVLLKNLFSRRYSQKICLRAVLACTESDSAQANTSLTFQPQAFLSALFYNSLTFQPQAFLSALFFNSLTFQPQAFLSALFFNSLTFKFF